MPADFQLNELAADPELINDFIVESREHLAAVELHLLALDQDAANAESLHAIFRGFHTIKGLAGFLGLDAIQEVAHEVETLLDLARNGQISVSSEHVDVILTSKDYLQRWLAELAEMSATGKAPSASANDDLLASIRRMGQKSEEPVAPALAALSQAQDPERAPASDQHSETRSIKVDTQKLDYLVDMVGEMVIAQSLVEHDPDLSLQGKPRLSRNLAQLARITGEVQRTAMAMRMIPIRQLFRKMSRLVRDLSRKTGKQIDLELQGEDTELDRNIVEELADPLMHMVRNAVDHGIETPEERAATGKNPAARLLLKAGHQAGHILLQVTDDGRGLNPEKILRKAAERGLVDEFVQLSESEVFNLIFAPGFSTAEQVTSVSGRGVGMDVVKKQIMKLRGKIEIQSTLGQGASFFLKVPLTLAIIDGLLVGVGGESYVVPIFAVREMFRPTGDALSTVENRDEMVMVRGSLLPVVRLHRRFGIRPRSENLAESVLIVTEAQGKRFCLVVDELIGKQEVVIKSLGESLRSIRGVAGGAILGDGRVGLILDPEGLFGQAAA
ncbi:MAG: chemotaxis protein CheA [Acidobacteriia bacterium]|nr:chemotaxis protein CheA [Terriglobia bacterium]